jgi:hypothetical protein
MHYTVVFKKSDIQDIQRSQRSICNRRKKNKLQKREIVHLFKARACSVHTRPHDYFTVRKCFDNLVVDIKRKSGSHKKILCGHWCNSNQLMKHLFKSFFAKQDVHFIQNNTANTEHLRFYDDKVKIIILVKILLWFKVQSI